MRDCSLTAPRGVYSLDRAVRATGATFHEHRGFQSLPFPGMRSVCVVVLNYRTWQDTVECVRSLLRDPYRPRHIVIVDNASDNDSVQRITGWAEGEGIRLERRSAAGGTDGWDDAGPRS